MRTVDPIRRGLRPEFTSFLVFTMIAVRTVDPIRRGLRRYDCAIVCLPAEP